jgi:hypothetical protein
MFFQSRVTWQKQRINLAIAVQVSNDTAVQDCEVKGRCLLPSALLVSLSLFPPALLLELVDNGTRGKGFSFVFASSCAHRHWSKFLTQSLVLDSPPRPLMKRVSEAIQYVPATGIIWQVSAAHRGVQSGSLDGLGDW